MEYSVKKDNQLFLSYTFVLANCLYRFKDIISFLVSTTKIGTNLKILITWKHYLYF